MTEVYVAAMVASLSIDALLTELFVATLPVTVLAVCDQWVLKRLGPDWLYAVCLILLGYSVAWIVFLPRTGLLVIDAIGVGILALSAGATFFLLRRLSTVKHLFK